MSEVIGAILPMVSINHITTRRGLRRAPQSQVRRSCCLQGRFRSDARWDRGRYTALTGQGASTDATAVSRSGNRAVVKWPAPRSGDEPAVRVNDSRKEQAFTCDALGQAGEVAESSAIANCDCADGATER